MTLPGEAGMPFLLALSGASRPGIPLRLLPGFGFEHLPLAPDALFWASLQANLVTVLSAQGSASYPLKIPNDKNLLWLKFHSAGLSIRPSGIGAITNRVPLQVVR